MERLDHYERLTEELLAPYADKPLKRSRRICALYATLWLEDPVLYGWFGLASFVARQIVLALQDRSFVTAPWDQFFADGNVGIFRFMVPDLLRFRDGVPITSSLAPAWELIGRARRETDWGTVVELTREALRLQCRAEQTTVVQPHFDAHFRKLGWRRHVLARGFHIRLGWDSKAPILHFDGDDPSVLEQRIAWMERKILPAWWDAMEARPEEIRRDCDVNRRTAGVRASDIPPPTWGGRPLRPERFLTSTTPCPSTPARSSA